MNEKRTLTEQQISEKILRTFSDFIDIGVKIVKEPHPKDVKSSNIIRPDFIINYGDETFAVFEIKNNSDVNTKEGIKRMFEKYRKTYHNCCYIGRCGEDFYYYNNETNDYSKQSLDSVLEILMQTLEGREKDTTSNDINALIKAIDDIDHNSIGVSEEKKVEYKAIICRHLKNKDKGNLKAHGNMLFFDKKTEKEIMYSLLSAESKTVDSKTQKPTELCRYTGAFGFYKSLMSHSFRMNSIESFNDAFETKAIEGYEKLKDTKRSINERRFNGFIMCFTLEDRKDKLFNWHMYGGNAEGVCFTVNELDYDNDDYFFAPVVYVEDKGEEKYKCELLAFLNHLMDLRVDRDKVFSLRLWYLWKYFFKYDYYKEEKEIRLVCLTNDRGKPEWNKSYEMQYYYIKRDFSELPFSLKDIILGPRCGGKVFPMDVFKDIDSEKHHIEWSIIKGYKG